MSYKYYKTQIHGKVTKLAIYQQFKEKLAFLSGVSEDGGEFKIAEMVEIDLNEYRELVGKLNIGHRYSNVEPVYN